MTEEPIKFLLVDDTPENLVALAALLRRDGVELLQARSGAEALELLLAHEVALALLDVQMPEMDGFELAELMRGSERTKHVPIIFVTAGVLDPRRLFKGYESGAVDFLFKPIEPHVLKTKADVFFQLARQRRQLSQALRLNEMFMAILGHDLRNPLGTLVTGLELLQNQLVDPFQLRVLQRMSSASGRMTRMIEQLLDLTRARLGGGIDLVSARKPVDLATLVRRAVDELRGAYPHCAIEVLAEGATEINGDADRLLQLLSNLLANAVQHGSAGGTVEIEVVGRESEVAISVRNRGVIPAELLPNLFDPFRSRRSAGSGSHGLGLGLFIAKHIVEAHGGRIAVQTSSERGETVFTASIPRGSGAAAPATGRIADSCA